MTGRVVTVSLGCLFLFVFPAQAAEDEGIPLEIQAGRLKVYPQDEIVVLSDRANVMSGDLSLSADRMVLDQRNGTATARGNVRLWYRGERVRGEEAICNFRKEEAVILNAAYDGFTLFAEADKIDLRQTERDSEFVLHHSRITTCDLAIPHYYLAANTIVIEPERRVVIRDSAVYIDEYPVFYLPFYRRSLRERTYGFIVTPGYSSKKGAVLYNTFTYYHNEWVRPRLYADWYSRVGVGYGASNRFGSEQSETFRGRIYGYRVDGKPDNPYLGEEEDIGKDIDEDRWRLAGHFYRELARDLVFSTRFQKLSDEDFNEDFNDVGRHHHFTDQELEADRNSFANLAKRWDSLNMRVLYKERLHEDVFLTDLPDDERKPQLTVDMMENRILESPLFWDALVQYDQNYRIERQQNFPDDPVLGIDARDDFLTRRETDRLHGEFLLSLPFSASFLRVIPRGGVRANSYEDTFRSVEYTDNIGGDDSVYREEFESVDQVAGQVGVELNTRAVAESAGPVGRFDKMRLVVEPNATFDVFDAKEDLTVENPINTELRGPLAGDLPGIVSLPDGHPVFDENDIPLRDARILGGRLDTKIQGRTAGSGTLDLLTHSISTAYDFENEEYSDLHSELFIRPIQALRISNFIAYDLNDNFTREASVGGDLEALSRLMLSAYYSNYRETVDSERQEFLSGGFEYKLGDKYTIGLSSRYDLDEGRPLRTTARIARDLHDAVANVLLQYKNATEERASEFEVRLVINIPFETPGNIVAEAF